MLRTFGKRIPPRYATKLSPVSLVEIPAPALPTSRWVQLRPRLSGICGSDLATVCARGSPYLAPLTSMPFVLGHEVVGEVTRAGSDVSRVQVGDRVVLQPALGCEVRGIAPPCAACSSGEVALCRNVTRGDISAGIQTGFCRDTGGAWSESLVAHESQLFRVPAAVGDGLAVLVEPFACALHGVLKAQVQCQDVVLIMGCGSIGLLTLAALRASGCRSRVVAVGKYDHQLSMARTLGADEVLTFDEDVQARYSRMADALSAEVLPPEMGRATVIGGADVTFDCVASSITLDDCCRFTTSGGRMVVVGMPAVPSGVDWTSIWFKELSICAAYAYGVEQWQGCRRKTFELALEFLEQCADELLPLVGEPFELRKYHSALQSALNTGSSRTIKTVFRV